MKAFHQVPRTCENVAAQGVAVAAIAAGVWIGIAWMPKLPSLVNGVGQFGIELSSAAHAQPLVLDVDSVTALFYEQLPELLENRTAEQQEADPNLRNTLVSRMLRYHVLKSRSPLYRLDWKLTLADYLGVNETIQPDDYVRVGGSTAEDLDRDRASVAALSRSQREALVNTLVAIYNPNAAQQPSAATQQPPRPPGSTQQSLQQPLSLPPGMGSSQPLPQEPRPGDAQLLLP